MLEIHAVPYLIDNMINLYKSVKERKIYLHSYKYLLTILSLESSEDCLVNFKKRGEKLFNIQEFVNTLFRINTGLNRKKRIFWKILGSIFRTEILINNAMSVLLNGKVLQGACTLQPLHLIEDMSYSRGMMDEWRVVTLLL